MNSLKAGEVECLQELSSEFIAAILPFKYDEKSVAEYMAELRFHKAQELLLITDHPAKKIGEMVGSTT